MLVTGTNIPAGATIASIDSPTQTITLSAPVTAGTGSTNETLKFSVQDPDVFRVAGGTTVEAIVHSRDQGYPGYVALSTTEAGNEHVLLPGKVFLDEIRFIKRDELSNSFFLNGGYGITVPGITNSVEQKDLYENLSATWTVAGSYIGVQREARVNGGLVPASNGDGPLNTLVFAKLVVDSGSDDLFSRYGKTDRYGNLYGLPESVPVNGGDEGEVLLPPEAPDDPDDPPNPGDPDPDPPG
jgi:hypothetical protein